jgi:hypothetical protein
VRRKRLKDQSTGIFDVRDGSDADDAIAVLGGPTKDSGVLGRPSHTSGLFDAPDEAPGGTHLFDRPCRLTGEGAAVSAESVRAAPGGLFDKPAPRRK